MAGRTFTVACETAIAALERSIWADCPTLTISEKRCCRWLLASNAIAFYGALCAAVRAHRRVATLKHRNRSPPFNEYLVRGRLKNAYQYRLGVDKAIRVPHWANFETHCSKAEMARASAAGVSQAYNDSLILSQCTRHAFVIEQVVALEVDR